MKKIAVINQKGGVGKTTSVVNISAGLGRLGRSVMAMDMDPQSHLTFSLGIREEVPSGGVYGLMKGDLSLPETLVEAGGMALVPSSADLSGLEVELAGRPGREYALRDALGTVSGYDFLFMDCPPTLGLLSLNALVAADEVYIPLQAEFLALQGLGRLLQSVRKVRERLNAGLEIGGVFATRFDRRRGLNNEVLTMLYDYFKEKLFQTVIRDNIALAEAPSHGRSIFDYRAKSHGAEDYMSLCKEILKRSGS
jgi:chromosome partitioning protein